MSAAPLIIGHRGTAGLAPENSLAGFALAAEIGADGIECDLHLSADGVPVVIHDAALGRTTDGKGPISQRTSAALARVRLRDGSTLPSLEDVAQLLAPTGLLLDLEIKTAARGRRYPGIEAAAAECLAGAGMLGRTIVSSFDWRCVAEFLALATPRAALGILNRRGVILAGGAGRALQRARKRGFAGICVPLDSIRRKRLKPADRAGIWIYGANDAAGIRAALDLQPGAIITDRPDIALGLRRAPRQG